MAAYRISMQAICDIARAEAIAEYLQVIPGFFAIERPPHEVDRERVHLDFSIIVRDEVREDTLLRTAEERVGQYLWQRPDLQPVDVKAQAQERLPANEEPQLPPEHIPPRRSL